MWALFLLKAPRGGYLRREQTIQDENLTCQKISAVWIMVTPLEVTQNSS